LSKWPCFLLSAPKAPPFTQLPPLLVTKPSMVKKIVITVVLDPALQTKVNEVMLAAASKHHIQLDGKVAFYFKTQYTYTGNKNLAPRTKETYTLITGTCGSFWHRLATLTPCCCFCLRVSSAYLP